MLLAIKDYVLSQPTVLADILQPILDSLKTEIITNNASNNQTEVVDVKLANLTGETLEKDAISDHLLTLHGRFYLL